jgi:EAL domain-containing protein (putative c-di-GMP-specific phosphodiesterase class I)
MPLQQLVNYFNQRFIEEQGLAGSPLRLRELRAEGRCEGLWFGSLLHPVYAYPEVSSLIAYDASLQVVETTGPTGLLPDELTLARAGSTHDSLSALYRRDDTGSTSERAVVDLDRLSRTVHLLNFLVFSHEVRSVFLHVHPLHILAVEKDHGAYFEEVILRCGLLPKRIVITLPVSRAYANQASILLSRLRNYRERGYATALKFEDDLEDASYLKFLNQFTPDFVRFERSILEKRLKTNTSSRARTSTLLERIHQKDTRLLVEGIRTPHDAEIIDRLQPDAVKGDYFKAISRVETEAVARVVNY